GTPASAAGARSEPQASEVHQTGARSEPQASEVHQLARVGSAGIARLQHAWLAPARTLEERVDRVRRLADQIGLSDLDPLARAVLVDRSDASGLARARAAVALAPALPAAHAALALAHWGQARDLGGALSAALDAARAAPRHLEALLWMEASFGVLGLISLVITAFAYIALRGLAALRLAAHDLGDLVETTMPEFSRTALVGSLVLLPWALGEGPFGALLALFAIAACYGHAAQRRALAAAAVLLVLALHPLAQLTGRALAALGADTVATASWAAESGFLDPVELARLERVGHSDPVAMHALALHAKRSGDLATADARYRALLAADGTDPVVLNNAANVTLALGNTESAIDLYRRATAERASAHIWFNLSQAHGRAIEVEQHESALSVAQSIDPVAVGRLTARLAESRGGFAADLPIPLRTLHARLHDRSGAAAADALRRTLAPGRIGASPWLAGGAFGALLLLSLVAAGRGDRSFWCRECCARVCARCHPGRGVLCEACSSRRRGRETSWEGRAAESAPGALLGARALRVLGRFVPVVGPSARRSGLGLTAFGLAIATVVFVLGRTGVVPDPLAVGAAGPLLLIAAAAACGLGWALVVLLGLALREPR
ncbi:MAG: hypothetical protein QNK03_27540, partial [Myxococcota bacterium]|nr:hypothetical protein [Myxococcota bacterium]